jgi:hypothetical protein
MKENKLSLFINYKYLSENLDNSRGQTKKKINVENLLRWLAGSKN